MPQETPHQPIVQDLQALLARRPDLAAALEASLRRADYRGVRTPEACLAFLDALVVHVPTGRDLKPQMNEFHYLFAHSAELQDDPDFTAWKVRFAQDWGSFLDTPESARGLDTFLTDPAYRMDDYLPGPSGWRTFNQFFAREVKPGRRPVAGLCDDTAVVSPADSVFMGQWPIAPDATLTVKGITFPIAELLAGSPHASAFEGGTFTHSYLNVTDYHRYHTPVRGRVLEARKIPGKVSLEVHKRPDGTLESRDGTGYQFTQDRGLLVLDSPAGRVAVLPIGMGHVSSVNLFAEPGTDLRKGELFGYFLFGGSDMVLLFEPGRVDLTAETGVHYPQGRQVGRVRP